MEIDLIHATRRTPPRLRHHAALAEDLLSLESSHQTTGNRLGQARDRGLFPVENGNSSSPAAVFSARKFFSDLPGMGPL